MGIPEEAKEAPEYLTNQFINSDNFSKKVEGELPSYSPKGLFK
ncbi:hypothetical protein GCM10007049_33680 [Echinicola pacifica]|uniref:Uncharacterized protein n=1 Tax=Echinicola pacifica TaxID=346377 RepID=A0A918UW79_9BACT|nr:hypothetical protein GCM10007049_33680 [Echinicola pacifica]